MKGPRDDGTMEQWNKGVGAWIGVLPSLNGSAALTDRGRHCRRATTIPCWPSLLSHDVPRRPIAS